MQPLEKYIEEEPHQCNYCGKEFRPICGLLSHTRVQTGEKPH